MNHNIGTIILATTDDIQFLYKLLDQTLFFSSQIIISFGSLFYNNECENEDLINEFKEHYSNNEKVSIIRYNIPEDYIPNTNVRDSNYWHCHGRWKAIQKFNETIEYVLLLDADEIPEGEGFLNWLDTREYINYDCMKLANYWYFRQVYFRANVIEDSIVFFKKCHADNINLTMQTGERTSTYDLCSGNKIRNIMYNNKPMFHHYSWVRTYKQMIRKVQSWGHKGDKDYTSLVNEEFNHSFNNTEKIFGHTYEIAPDIFDIGTI
jgi:hypothetical protein